MHNFPPAYADHMLPRRNYEKLAHPTTPMSGNEQELFRISFEEYLNKSGVELDATEYALAYAVGRAMWWERHLLAQRRGEPRRVSNSEMRRRQAQGE